MNDLLYFILPTDNIPDAMQRTVAWWNAQSTGRSQTCWALLGKELRLWLYRRLGVLACEECMFSKAVSVDASKWICSRTRRVSVTVLRIKMTVRQTHALVSKCTPEADLSPSSRDTTMHEPCYMLVVMLFSPSQHKSQIVETQIGKENLVDQPFVERRRVPSMIHPLSTEPIRCPLRVSSKRKIQERKTKIAESQTQVNCAFHSMTCMQSLTTRTQQLLFLFHTTDENFTHHHFATGQ